MSQKTIEAVVEITNYDEDPPVAPWALMADGSPTFVRLSSATTDEEIGSLMLLACSYNQTEILPTALETLNAFLAEEHFVLPGGFQLSEDGRVKIVPGCCCGLETWREWLEVPDGGFIWMGHDPDAGVESIGDKIRAWADGTGDDSEFIDFEPGELRGLVLKAEADLKDFVVRLKQWADKIASELKDKLAEYFDVNMNISEARIEGLETSVFISGNLDEKL